MEHDSCATTISLPESIRLPTLKFLNWVYNDLFHADGGPARSGTSDIPGIAGFGALIRVSYEWHAEHDASVLTIAMVDVPGVIGFEPCSVGRRASTLADRPPFSLLMRVWVDLCYELGLLTEAGYDTVDDPIEQMKSLEWSTHGDCW